MTIAFYAVDPMSAGMHDYTPEGPFGAAGNFPLPSFKPGQVLVGDAEAEFTYCMFAVPASLTLNQGDVLCWDNSYNATRTAEVLAAGEYPMGTAAGTFFLGGSVGNPAAFPSAGSLWSFTFPAGGVYGLWVQRYGTSLINVAVLSAASPSAAGTLVFPQTTATPARVTFLTTSAATTLNGITAGTLNTCAFSRTFVANSTAGSGVLAAVTTCKFLVRGMTITGAGIPAVSSTQGNFYITDIQGTTVTITSPQGVGGITTTSGSTYTANNGLTTGNTVNGSPLVTNVPSIAGLYPNQAVTMAGFASPVIKSIGGVPGAYTITMTVNASATANNVQLTLNTTNNYVEGFLRSPTYATAL
jgi:hypothetical protein